MAEQTITIGGKEFQVACNEGEEHFLEAAARMLDAEAQVLLSQIGRMPEVRMLLMAGLMLADRTAAIEDQLRETREQLAAREAELAGRPARPAPVEVPAIPRAVREDMAELAARAEALADQLEETRKG